MSKIAVGMLNTAEDELSFQDGKYSSFQRLLKKSLLFSMSLERRIDRTNFRKDGSLLYSNTPHLPRQISFIPSELMSLQ